MLHKHSNDAVTYYSNLLIVKDLWEEIFNNCKVKSPLLTFEFINLWYDCFASPNQIRIYRALHEDGIIGLLPLVLHKKKGVRILKGLTNDHCFHGDPLIREGYEDVFPELILRSLLQDRNNWDVFVHSFSYSFSVNPGLVPENLLREAGLLWERRIQPTYSILLDKPYKSYFSKDLSHKNRTNIKRRQRLLAEAGSVVWKHYKGSDAVFFWPEFVRIEDSGWKGAAGSSIAKIGSNFKRYYEEVIFLLSRYNALNLYFLELNGDIIAGVFGYVIGDTFCYVKTAYDENFKLFSPSNLLLLHIIEDLIANCPSIKRCHMFPWDYGYKHRFSNEEDTCIESIIFNQSLRGKLFWYNFAAKKNIKRFLKI